MTNSLTKPINTQQSSRWPVIRRLCQYTVLSGLMSTISWAAPTQVVTSFSILGDMVQEVGGEHVQVSTLVGADSDMHVYQPTPKDIQRLQTADIVVLNGLGFEGWQTRLLDAANYKGAVVIASNGVTAMANDQDDDKHAEPEQSQDMHHDEHEHEQAHEHEHEHEHEHDHGMNDPHAWLDVKNAKIYVNNIVQSLVAHDAAHADYFKERAERYLARLTALDAELLQMANTIPASNKVLITQHLSFAYFAKAYGFEHTALGGLSTETEVGAKHLAELVKRIKQQSVKAIFDEKLSNNQLLKRLSEESAVPIGGVLYSDSLSPKGDSAESYEKLMRHNMSQLVHSLR